MHIGGHEVVTATRSTLMHWTKYGKQQAANIGQSAAQNIDPHEKVQSEPCACLSLLDLESRSRLEHREGKLKQRLLVSLC